MNKDYTVEEMLEMIEFDDRGLVPAVVQEAETNRILMLAYMNEQSFRQTIKKQKACFYSRSRQELWLKGETSGNYQHVRQIKIDCDGDTILLLVTPEGPACHTGEKSCFYQSLKKFTKQDFRDDNFELNKIDKTEEFDIKILSKLARLIAERNKNRPENSYTVELLESDLQYLAQKIGEEGVELSLAVLEQDEKEINREAADLIYHLLVMLEASDLSLQGVLAELSKRYNK